MDRKTGRRSTAILAVLLLLLPGVGEALGRTCQHHDVAVRSDAGHHAHHEAPAHERGAATDPSGHQHHHGGHAGEEPTATDAPAPSEHEHHGCTCAGSCHSGSPVAAPASPPASASTVFHGSTILRPHVRADRAPLLFPFVLPYAQAPPVGC